MEVHLRRRVPAALYTTAAAFLLQTGALIYVTILVAQGNQPPWDQPCYVDITDSMDRSLRVRGRAAAP